MKKLLVFFVIVVSVFLMMLNDNSPSGFDKYKEERRLEEQRRLYYDYEEVGTPTIEKNTKGVYNFTLTEVNSREIEGLATFIVNTPINRFELKVDGETFYYTPTGRVGDDPLCGITATDKFGRSTAICVEIISRSNVKVRVWNSGQRFNFKGYASN
jgi:hypothetical protein